jgi:hypothetical protein
MSDMSKTEPKYPNQSINISKSIFNKAKKFNELKVFDSKSEFYREMVNDFIPIYEKFREEIKDEDLGKGQIVSVSLPPNQMEYKHRLENIKDDKIFFSVSEFFRMSVFWYFLTHSEKNLIEQAREERRKEKREKIRSQIERETRKKNVDVILSTEEINQLDPNNKRVKIKPERHKTLNNIFYRDVFNKTTNEFMRIPKSNF